MNLSSISIKAIATSLLLVSTTGLAFAKHHKVVRHTEVESYKGEANYKAEAIPCPSPKMLMSGFYVGAGVGYDSYRTRIASSVSSSEEQTNVTSSLSASHSNAANGWAGSLFVGYGQYFNDAYYLGAEAFGSFSGAQGSHNINLQQTIDVTNNEVKLRSRLEANWGWGVALLPGLKLADTLLAYVRLGYNWANLEGKVTGNINNLSLVSKSADETVGGFAYGVGMESLVHENWSLRGEFTHTDYNSLNTKSHVTEDTLIAGRTKFDPSDNQFMLSVIYHIA